MRWKIMTRLSGFRAKTYSRQFSGISKNFNSRRKADRNFSDNFLESHFSHLKLYSNAPSWLPRNRCQMSTLRKTKGWSSQFWQGQHLGFSAWDDTAKEDLNPQKQVVLLNLRLWPTLKLNIWSIFYRKMLLYEKSVGKS